MRSNVVTIKERMKEKKRIKTNIGVGYVVNAKVGEIKEKTREGRIRLTRKEMVGCFKAMVGKRILLFKLEDGKNK